MVRNQICSAAERQDFLTISRGERDREEEFRVTPKVLASAADRQRSCWLNGTGCRSRKEEEVLLPSNPI